MTSNQDNKQKILDIPITGIQVMNDLSVGARTVIYLAHEGLLKPYIPVGATKHHFMLCMNSRYESPESFLTGWIYWKSDVEDFICHRAVQSS